MTTYYDTVARTHDIRLLNVC